MIRKLLCLFNGILLLVPILSATAQDVDVPGNLTMVDSVAMAGNILKQGVPFIHNFGENNTFLGAYAGNLTMSGISNTGIGNSALYNNDSGGYNTANGFLALLSNTTGEVNTASGCWALSANTVGTDNTATGCFSLLSNTSGLFNTATGVGSLRPNTTGSSNTATGYRALFSNVTGSFNTAFGYGADVASDSFTNATVIGANAIVDASNKIRLGDTEITVIEGQVPFTYTSDRNQKENLRPVHGERVLSKIRALSLTSWNYVGQDPTRFRHYGPMAQDFFAAFGRDGVGSIGTPTTITSGDLDGILMVAAKALEERTADQQREIETLKVKNADLERRLEAFERKFGLGQHPSDGETVNPP